MKNQVNFSISIAKNCLQSKESKLAPKKWVFPTDLKLEKCNIHKDLTH